MNWNSITLLLAGMAAIQAVPAQQHPERRVNVQTFTTDKPMVHDPVMAEEDGHYYLFSTGRGIQVAESDNRKSWKVWRNRPRYNNPCYTLVYRNSPLLATNSRNPPCHTIPWHRCNSYTMVSYIFDILEGRKECKPSTVRPLTIRYISYSLSSFNLIFCLVIANNIQLIRALAKIGAQ